MSAVQRDRTPWRLPCFRSWSMAIAATHTRLGRSQLSSAQTRIARTLPDHGRFVVFAHFRQRRCQAASALQAHAAWSSGSVRNSSGAARLTPLTHRRALSIPARARRVCDSEARVRV
jgi:hypothetical protein